MSDSESGTAPTAENCGNCHKCKGPRWLPDRMLLCPTCGNKRCPKASDHELTCSGSNEPGQPGSIYVVQPPAPVAEAEGRVTREAAFSAIGALSLGTATPEKALDNLRAFVRQQEAAEREAVELRKELERSKALAKGHLDLAIQWEELAQKWRREDYAKLQASESALAESQAKLSEAARKLAAQENNNAEMVALLNEIHTKARTTATLRGLPAVVETLFDAALSCSEAERKLAEAERETATTKAQIKSIITASMDTTALMSRLADGGMAQVAELQAQLQGQTEEREALLELANEWLQKAAQMRIEDGNVGALEALEDCANEVLGALPLKPPAAQEPTGGEPAKPALAGQQPWLPHLGETVRDAETGERLTVKAVYTGGPARFDCENADGELSNYMLSDLKPERTLQPEQDGFERWMGAAETRFRQTKAEQYPLGSPDHVYQLEAVLEHLLKAVRAVGSDPADPAPPKPGEVVTRAELVAAIRKVCAGKGYISHRIWSEIADELEREGGGNV